MIIENGKSLKREVGEGKNVSQRVIKPASIDGNGDLELSIEEHLISQPLAEVGIRNSGKSYLAGKICEQLCEVKQPFVVIDPEGEYWTLREKYPVLVASVGKPIGRPKGYKADIIVDSDTITILAQQIAEKGYTVIIDLRNATMEEAYKALGSFLESLYEAEGKHNRPLVVIMEEAHVLVPEIGRVRLKEIREAQNKVIYWTYEIAARGRHRGLGYICIARRAAEVAKAVISQCPSRIIFKLVDPADLSWLRESGLSSKEIDQVQNLPQGSALAIGISEEPFLIKTNPRLCTHGGKTPIAVVETPELEKAVEDLTKMLKIPPSKPARETLEKEKRSLLKKIDDLTKNFEEERKALQEELIQVKGINIALKQEAEALRQQLTELKEKSFPQEERDKLIQQVTDLEQQVSSLKEQLGEALQYEDTFQKIRELMDEEKELWLQISNLLGVELIPKDIQDVVRERDQLRQELDRYKKEEQLKRELIAETLEDPGIQSWIREAKSFLLDLKRRKGGLSIVFQQSIRMDPEIPFLPDELQTGVTSQTNLQYLNQLADKNLLWETRKRGRKAFRNRFKQWITENMRRIKPAAPDEAINHVHDELKELVLR